MIDTHLLMKYFKSLATQEEEKQIQYWLANDPDGSHQKAYQEAHKAFVGITLYSDQISQENKKDKNIFLRPFGKFLKVAAAVAVLFVMAYAGRQSVYHELYALNEKIYVPAGKSMNITLEDGTVIHLNAETEIEYPKLFSPKERIIKLNRGEILFDVAKDSSRPFIVKTFASDIEVLGTEFDVEVYPEEEVFKTVLIDGSVAVRSNLSDEVILMKPDDIVSMKDGRLEKNHLDNTNAYESWTKGILDISNMPFGQIIKKLEKIYGVDIVVGNPSLETISYSRAKVWISDGIDQVLSILQLAADFEYERKGNTIYIR